MDYNLLLKIMMKWSLDNKDYEIAYYLYTEHFIGIPINYIYKFPTKKLFSNVNCFLNNNDSIISNDKHLINLLKIFKKSKYIRLEEWDNSYGYRF